MKGIKIIFGFVLLLVVNLCGCGNGGYEQQLVGGFGSTENSEDNKETLQEDSFTEYVPSTVTKCRGLSHMGYRNSAWRIGDHDLASRNVSLTRKSIT